MSNIYLYIRNTGSKATLVTNISRESANDIIKKYKDTSYQLGILCAKDIKNLSMVYGEFAPYKEVDYTYIINILEEKVHDTLLDKSNRKSIYDLAKKLVSKSNLIKLEKEVTTEELDILSQIPYSHLSKIGRIEPIRSNSLEARKQKVINLRDYMKTDNLVNINDIYVACRKQQKVKGTDYALATWLKEGEIKAKDIDTDIFDLNKLISSIPKIREMTLKKQDEFHSELVELLSRSGIALVLVEKFPNTNVIGATQWVDEGRKAIIQLTLKGKRADSFWFTLFHEIAHIVKHDSKDFHIQNDGDNLKLEDEADNIARNWLIPDEEYTKFKLKRNISIYSIENFAKKVNIHACIVIGRLQHDKILDWSTYNMYKPKVRIM